MEDNKQTSMIVSDENSSMVGELSGSRQQIFCSFVPKNDDERDQLFNLSMNPTARLGDQINKVIEITHVYAEEVELTNERTGLKEKAPRIILFDNEFHGYATVSIGIFSAIKKIFSVYGTPDTWKKPLRLEVLQIKKGVNNILTLQVARSVPAKK